MVTSIEMVRVDQDPGTTLCEEVICIFCGLPTPVPAAGPIKFARHFPRHILIVRCEVCGKEAPYRDGDIAESGAICRARHSRSVRPEHP